MTPVGLTTQSKLTVQAPSSGNTSECSGICVKRRPWCYGGSARSCTLPRIWGGSLNGSLLDRLGKDVTLVSHCVLGLGHLVLSEKPRGRFVEKPRGRLKSQGEKPRGRLKAKGTFCLPYETCRQFLCFFHHLRRRGRFHAHHL